VIRPLDGNFPRNFKRLTADNRWVRLRLLSQPESGAQPGRFLGEIFVSALANLEGIAQNTGLAL
jgi:hypothetical protein